MAEQGGGKGTSGWALWGAEPAVQRGTMSTESGDGSPDVGATGVGAVRTWKTAASPLLVVGRCAPLKGFPLQPLANQSALGAGRCAADRLALRTTSFPGVDPPGGRNDDQGPLRTWAHQRSVEPIDAGCVVVDRLQPEAWIPLLQRLVEAGVGLLFRHRHRVLARQFGGDQQERAI